MRRYVRLLLSFLAGLGALTVVPAVEAQVFAPVPALSFTKVFGGADPLPQVVPIANVGTAFNFTVTSTATDGGTWLSVETASNCGLCGAPHPIIIKANPAVTLAAGSYTGEVVVKSQSGSVSMTIPVSLTVAAAGTAYFDNTPGALSFVMATNGAAPTTQTFQVRNAGTGALGFAMATSTSDGGSWLTTTSTDVTAPSVVTVSIAPARLPGGGLTAGTYIGLITFTSVTGSTTVPVSVVVGTTVLSQVNPLHFVKVFSGADPLPQTLAITSPGVGPNFFVGEYTAREQRGWT